MSDTIRYFLGDEDDALIALVRALGLAACAALTGFLMFTIAVGRYGNWTQYQVVLALVLAAIFFLFPGPLARFSRRADVLLSIGLAGLGVYAAWYMIDQHAEIAAYREGLPNSSDIFVYVTGTLIVLEAARRAEGWILLSIVAVTVGYLLAGPWLPGILSHRGMDSLQVAELFYSQQGIFGVALGSVVDIVYIYVIFGAALRLTGAGEFFDWIASRLTMGRRSGSAQCAIIASALFGSINGSASANVVANGAITINLMHRAGYSRAYAGAVEASSSVVGQILPPVMGVGAFIMAEITGIPYTQIMLAALLPALLFLLSLGIVAALEAARLGLKPLDEEPGAWTTQRISQFITIGGGFTVLLYLLMTGYSVDLSGLAATLTVIGLALVLPGTRPGWRELVRIAIEGGRDGLIVAASCAAIGVIIGAVSATGLGIKVSQAIMSLGGASLLLALILAAFCALVLGMGLPTAASYLMVVFIAGPALIQLGLPVLAAHMFLFYFAVMSAVTPPVPLAVFAAAAIAQVPMLQISMISLRLCLVAFLMPFMWVYSPELMLQDVSLETLPNVIIAAVTLVFAVLLLAAAQVGHFRGSLTVIERAAAALAALMIYLPYASSTTLGVLLGLSVLGRRYWLGRKTAMEAA